MKFTLTLPTLLCTLLTASAVPVAVNDSYSTAEDATLNGGSTVTTLLTADFEAGATDNLASGQWQYFDKIKNNLNGQTADGYPTDDESVDWKQLAFNTTTSSVAGWQSAPLPIQGGGVDGIPGAPNLLTGISTGGNYSVTTYLFRHTFTATAAQAAISAWSLRALVDDGAVFYLNGQEIGRLGMDADELQPAGPITTLTSTEANPEESTFLSLPVNLAGKLVAGNNVLSVEVHQTWGGGTQSSSDVGLDFTLTPDVLNGLVYADDVNGTTRPGGADGNLESGVGNPGNSLNIEIIRAGFGSGSGANVSGGWQKTLNLASAATVHVKCDARARALAGLDGPAEYVEAILLVDGTRFAPAGRNYLVRQLGPGTGDADSGWATYELDIPLTAGNHLVAFGGFGPRPSQNGENGVVNFDNISITTASGGATLLANDTGGATTAVLDGNPSHGTLSLNANGSFVYTPALNYNGPDSFTYHATDGASSSNIATVSITVTPVNDVPAAVADGPYAATEDAPLTVPAATGLLVNDSDVENQPLTAVIAVNSTNGNAVVNADGGFTFTPANNFSGAATFTYRASDGTGQSAATTVSINVASVPDNPVAVADTYTATRNTPLEVTATTGGFTTDEVVPYGSEEWHYFDSLVPANRNLGTAWRTDTFVESADWKVGAGEFGYGDDDEVTVISDNPDPAFDPAAGNKFITYYFRRTLDLPTATNILSASLQMRFDDGGVIFINGSEVARTDNLDDGPADLPFDFLVPQSSGENETQNWNNIPASNFRAGPNLIAVEIHQSAANSSDLSFDLRVRLTRTVAASVLANDTDADAGQTATLTAEVVAQPAHGTVAMNPNGTFTYTPANNYIGPDSFTYRAKDSSNALSAVTTASITVVAGPSVPPVAQPDSYTAVEDTELNIKVGGGVLANDTDAEGDPMTAVLVTTTAHGTLSLNSNGGFIYMPASDYNGPDSFTYRANDGRNSAPVTVSLTVTPVNDAPVAVNDSFTGDPGQTLTISSAQGVLANDTDVDAGTQLTAELVTPPAGGNLVLGSNGSFTFTAPGGNYSFTYRAKDAESQSAPATVSIAINAVPVTLPESYSTVEDTPLTVILSQGVLVNDSDPEGQSLTAQVVATSQHGALTLNANGTFTYSPASNYAGPDTFTYRAFDGTRYSQATAVSLTITPVNDAPQPATDNFRATLDTQLIVPAINGVLANDVDPDNTELTVQLVSTTAHGALALNADGSFSYMPVLGYLGPDSFNYRVSDGTLTSGTATANITVSDKNDSVTITEIMYNPPGGLSGEEFIEIHNTAPNPIDLSGWQFTAGVNYTFPVGRTIAGGAYLVIPANGAAFAAKYPGVSNYIPGGWGAASGLSNSGEKVTLKDNLGETVDSVEYSDSGEWAVRRIVNVWDHSNTGGQTPDNGGLDTDPSIEWYSSADPDPENRNAGGGSIQVRSLALSNNDGQNWAAAVPTPGAANSAVALTNSAPVITGVTHSPAVPSRTQQVIVKATLTDELTAGVSASVVYRTWLPAGQTPATGFVETPMFDDGLHGDGLPADGEFGAALPAQAIGTVVEFYVSAKDGQNNTRTWPAPTLDIDGANPVQNCNCLYQVDEELWEDSRPLYRMVTTGLENYRYDVGRWSAQSNESINCTFIVTHGQKSEIRYESSLRVRGNSSRSWNPRNWRLDLPGDRPWNDRTAFALNTKYIYSQYLAGRLVELAGLPGETTSVVGVRLNAVNHALDGNQNGTFGYYVDIMPMGGELIDHNFPFDSAGNGYAKIRGGNAWSTANLPVIGASGWATGGYINLGWSKKSNAPVNDWTDLDAWLQAVNDSSIANFHTFTASTLDIDEWVKWWALTAIINHAETNPSNGDDDDYSIYCGEIDRRAKIIAHDFDTCFNLNSIGLGDENASAAGTIFQATANPWPANDGATVPQMDKFYRNPVTGRKFKAAIKHLMDTLFEKTYFDNLVDTQLPPTFMGATLPNGNPVTPNGNAIRAAIKSFMDTRRTTIATFLPTAFTATTTLTVTNGYPTSAAANDLGGLGGSIDPVRTARVTVNGTTVAHSPYDNTWAAGNAVTLVPGLNTLVCTAWDESNALVASQTVTIFRTATGATRSGALTGSETWSAAGGPWNVSSSVTVPSGATLTISPGASVFLAAGANITAAAGGRLLAEGTAAAPIRFDRAPAATLNWAGIVVNGGAGSPESRLSNLIIDHNSSTAIQASAANVIIDRVTFLNAGTQYLSLNGSSFLVSNCTFPAPTGPFDMIRGTGGISAGGRGIIRDCVFGRPVGNSDSVNFSGGNRPGPILQVLNCVFNGSDNDALDLNSTDAWVEGNIFLHIHRNGASTDSASAVAGGDFIGGVKSEITIIRNLFYDCDFAVTLKEGNSFYLIQNTLARITKAGGTGLLSGALNFSEDPNPGVPAAGALIEGNVFFDTEALVRNYTSASTAVTFNNNILPVAWTGPGTGNTVADPLLLFIDPPDAASATAEQVRAAFQVPENSAARGTGMQGRDKGALVPEGIAVTLPRFSPNASTAFVLNPGPAAAIIPTAQPTWNSGYTSFRWSLDGGAVSAETPVTTPLSINGLVNGPHTLSIEGKRDSGDWQTTPSVYSWTVGTTTPTVVLNEVLATNLTAYTLGTTRPDIIELQNYGTVAVDIGNWTISDDPLEPARFTIPPGTVIPPGSYLAIMADGLPTQAGELHAGFGLESGGETVTLYQPGAVAVDSVSFGPQIANFSVGRSPVSGEWMLCVPSVGVVNTPYGGGFASGDALRLNEWLASNETIVDSDFVELYNPAAKPVILSGYALTDDLSNYGLALTAGDGSAYVIPPLSFIGAGGFTAFRANGGSSPDTLTFNLSKVHDSLTLLSPAGVDLDHVVVSPGLEDRSEGRTTDGGILIGYFSIPTPGLSNTTSVASETALLTGVRITEMMFDPPSSNQAEYIELKNISGSPQTLTGINFASGITHTFPATTLAAGAYIVITGELAKFNAQFPGVTATQWESGKLDNNGETVRFETAAFSLGILDFRYEGTWFPQTRSGASLEIINPNASRSSWNVRESWQPAVPSPGGPSSFGVVAPPDIEVTIPAPAVLHAFVFPGTVAPAGITLAWTKILGPGTVNFTAPASKDTDATFSAAGLYELRLTASGPGGSPTVGDSVFVTVSGGGSGESLAAWTARLLGSLSAADQGPNADPDRDGTVNVVEFAMGSDPTIRSAGPELINNNGRLALRYTRSKLINPAVQIIPQISSNAGTWLEGSPNLTQTVTNDTATSQTIVASDASVMVPGARKYLRLKVVSP